MAPLAPSKVRVQVRNATTRTGLARQVSNGLGQLQFASSVGADQTPGAAVTQVRYAAPDRQAALTVAAAVSGSAAREDATLAPGVVVLVLGSNYSHLQAVQRQGQASAGSAPTARPSAAGTPSPAPVTAESSNNRCTF